jgi:hypothetical protein
MPRALAVSPLAPFVDPRLDLGLFATIDHAESGDQPLTQVRGQGSGIAHSETMQLLQEWGYVGAQSSSH